LSFPLAAGDFVFLLFPEQTIGAWRALKGALTAPGDLRRHDLSGAVALPCLYPDSQALADAHASNVVLGFDGGQQIHVKAAGIALGTENPAKTAATAEDVAAELAKISADLTTLKAAISAGLGGVPTVGGGLATTFNGATAAVPQAHGSVASANVKLS
jgi:hypothetical protein